MSNTKAFVLDSNVFIEAKNRYYAFDIVPGFWNCLVNLARQKKIHSIKQIENELCAGNDELREWAKKDFIHFFVAADDKRVIDAYTKILNWVQQHPDYRDTAKADFANDPDGWIVAYAVAYDCIVVTHEGEIQGIKKRVPIPNLCKKFGVEYTNTFDMLRTLKTVIA